tara:strand:+ start:168 stop:350 length:183 start_codon:yes stop_codon:yes gene_type:complete
LELVELQDLLEDLIRDLMELIPLHLDLHQMQVDLVVLGGIVVVLVVQLVVVLISHLVVVV